MGEVVRMEPLSDLGRAARAYAERLGLHVFPCWWVVERADGTRDCACPPTSQSRQQRGLCGNPGKHPLTANGFKDASSDVGKIAAWWHRWPLAHIAIACGPSGLVVIDIDPRNGGDDTVHEIERARGAMPDTWRQLTGGGGEHRIYRRPAVPHVRGPRDGLGRGVDVKADGGYIIAAPSGHIAGRVYAWDLAALPSETPLADLPAWILERLDQRERAHVASGASVLDGFLGAAFEAAGWLGQPLGTDKAAARCPWEDEHSGGSRFDSSTVLFAPQANSRRGWWYCAHEHCRHRTQLDVLRALPDGAKAAAREKLGLAPEYDPARDEPVTSGTELTPPPAEDDWRSGLRFTSDGRLTRDPGNAAVLLANLPEWDGVLEYDAFADAVRWVRPAPALPGLPAPAPGDLLADHHIVYTQQWLARFRALSVGREAVASALDAAARRHTVHPLQRYLAALRWDGLGRVGAWLTTYCGAGDDTVTSTIGIRWLISAVARARQPGCQADHMLILEGPQGRGKSRVVRELAGAWYLGSLPDLRNRDAAHMLAGHWIVEIGELDAFRGASSTRIKDWITQTIDVYRPAYGHFQVRRPRQCVFVGTTNESHYLGDATGARRFWPVTCGRIDSEGLRRDRDQLWAEAVRLYEDGIAWWPDGDEAHHLETRQGERYREDVWESLILDALDARTSVTVQELLADVVKLDPGKWTRTEQMRVADILKRAGWVQGARQNNQRRWMRPEASASAGGSP